MKRHAFCFLLLLSFVQFTNAQKTEDSIRLPSNVPSVAPVLPSTSQKLSADVWFIIDSDVECLVLVSPSPHVKITKETGPLRVRGKFVDGDGKVETRSFNGKFIYTLEAALSGKCEVLVVPPNAKEEKEVRRRNLEVEAGTTPPKPDDPPKPDPPKPDPPKPNPAPIPGDGLRVLMVYETGDKISLEQHSIIFGKKIRDYLNDKCPVGPDGKTKEWRIYDKDVVLDGESKLWKDAMKRTRTASPWLIISNGKEGFEGPLPANVDETMKLIQKYGG